MADHSDIEWTDATWNPITGCSIKSPGCAHCYAMTLAGTRLRNHPSRAGLTDPSKTGPVWNGVVRLNPQWLPQPLNWRRSRRIFVCAHGDLFHENVPDEWIDQVFAVMALAHWHTFQVLTKRSARMREYSTRWFERLATNVVPVDHPTGRSNFSEMVDWTVLPPVLPNVWLGTSAERQQEYDERSSDLQHTRAAVRFFSMEPLIGPIEANYLGDWVIVGGESGANARPMKPAWARSLRDQCTAAGVPFFFKQWGEWAPSAPRSLNSERVGKKHAGRLLDGIEHNGMPERAA